MARTVLVCFIRRLMRALLEMQDIPTARKVVTGDPLVPSLICPVRRAR